MTLYNDFYGVERRLYPHKVIKISKLVGGET